MAELVLGVGTSHSPLLTLSGEDWVVWGEHDRTSRDLIDESGTRVTFDERVAAVGDRFADGTDVGRCIASRARTDAALDELARRIDATGVDAVVVVGDDQDEHLLENNLPSLMVYWGDEILNTTAHDLVDRPEIVQRFMTGYLEDGPARTYPVESKLASHLIDVMLDHRIDVASARTMPNPHKAMGHAFGFPVRRLIPEGVPLVPVMINTYNPPSQPRASRCVDYGRAIRNAIESYGAGRVAVLASGGLSHFLVMPDLDRRFIDDFRRHDLDDLAAVPEALYQAGTSEVKNWIVAAAACDAMDFDLIDYVPGYRTIAGSGTGLAFATWQPT